MRNMSIIAVLALELLATAWGISKWEEVELTFGTDWETEYVAVGTCLMGKALLTMALKWSMIWFLSCSAWECTR